MQFRQTRNIETRHGAVAIRDTEGQGPAVFFIHGNSSCSLVFEAQFEGPLAERHRLVAMDLPGHGESADAGDPGRTYSMPSYAEAAADVLASLDIADPVVLGWSLGGHIGIEMTHLLPGMRGLVITGTPPAGPGAEEVNVAFAQIPELAFAGTEDFSEEQVQTFARYIYSLTKPASAELVEAVRRTDGRARQCMFADFLDPASRLKPQIRSVASWPKPLAIIQGSDEPFMDLAYFDTLDYANLWRGQVQVIEGCGHAPFLERPEDYNPLLEAFLADLA